MSLLSILLARPKSAGMRSIRVVPPVALVNRRQAVRVPRNTKSLADERGWHRTGSTLDGHYRTKLGSFRGRIDLAKREYFIIDPPSALLNGAHGGCFHQRDRHTFFIHWNKAPTDINAGILHIEHLLIEALS